MKNLFKISTGISEMPITQQKNTSGGFWDDTIGLSTVIIGPDPDWPSFSFPSSTPPTYGSGGGGYEPDPEENDNIKDPDKVLESYKNFINEQIASLKEALKLELGDPEKIQKVIDAYEKSIKTIDLMENSDKKYRIDVKDNYDNNTSQDNAQTTYDTKTGEYVITIEALENGGDIALLAHELEHVDQIENGELNIDQNGNITGYDIQDEVDAYQQQETIFNGVNFIEITPEYIWETYPGVYDNLKPKDNGGNDDNGGFESLSSYSRS